MRLTVVMELALAEVGECSAGVLEGDSVGGLGSCEGVAGCDGVPHEQLPILTPHHRLLVLDLRLRAPHRGLSATAERPNAVVGLAFPSRLRERCINLFFCPYEIGSSPTVLFTRLIIRRSCQRSDVRSRERSEYVWRGSTDGQLEEGD